MEIFSLERMVATIEGLRWRGKTRSPAVVGIFALPRGGSNFISAALHYHPQLFAITETYVDYRIPLRSLWKRRSIFREHGRQDKKFDDIQFIIFNKVQNEDSPLWDPQATFPETTRHLFYLRNPIRVHHSRERYRQVYSPKLHDWADTHGNYCSVLADAQRILDAYHALNRRYPCMLVSHEHVCCEHETALAAIHSFLGLPPVPFPDPRKFFRRCGVCGRDLITIEHEGKAWLACRRHPRRVRARGNFNPLQPIDSKGVKEDSWKNDPRIERMIDEMRHVLGHAVADYYWRGDYSRNLTLGSESVRQAA